MNDLLLDAVRRYLDDHGQRAADSTSMARAPIPGLTTIRATAPSGLVHAISRPLICLVLQGRKHVTLGTQGFTFAAGDSLLITADVPTVSQITEASESRPYLSLVLDLDAAIIAELSLQLPPQSSPEGLAVRCEPTDLQVADAALRLMQLLDRPAAVPILHAQHVRELHYWLLVGRHGAAIRRLGWPSYGQRIAKAIELLRDDFAQPLPVTQLAAAVGMSASSFHQHFRAVTSLSPLQFQKQLRLIEARRLLLAEGTTASAAAFRVGYESVPQFTREYGRLFGLPPSKDIALIKVSTATEHIQQYN